MAILFVRNDQSCARKILKRFFLLRVTSALSSRESEALGCSAKKTACWYKKQMSVCCLASIVYYSSG